MTKHVTALGNDHMASIGKFAATLGCAAMAAVAIPVFATANPTSARPRRDLGLNPASQHTRNLRSHHCERSTLLRHVSNRQQLGSGP